MATRPKHAAYLKKDPSPVQTEFAAWIEKVTGHVVPVGDVALVQRLYPLYLKTPEVVKAREAAAKARKKEAEEREKRVKEKKAARLAQIEKDRIRLMKDLGIEPEEAATILSVVPATVAEEQEEETTDESTGLVLGETDDEFVEPDTSEDDDFGPETADEDDDLWEDPDEVEDF